MKLGMIIRLATITFAMLPCATLANDILQAESTLSFEGVAGGEVWVNFDARWTNTTGKALCIREGMFPGLNDFDPGVIEFYGPTGKLEVREAPPWRHYPDIDALRLLVVLPGASVRMGHRIGRDDYIFKERGSYRAVFRMELYDCGELPNLKENIWLDNPKWFLGHLYTESAATLK